ncbi:Ig-like domain-containing protein [Vibrio campbellii]|uniref:Ig-like domain-containing protein n=1 Tax=Vibrio campbellii TaxID=680 RepID=UPI001D1731C4|nr:Ig-like domain-containing protein [Vibrio campbellii]MCC4224470.1 Ig-like domain-containing protein [Vibrio campbellii]
MSLLTVFGCNDSITETTTSLTSQISHQQSLSLNVSNRVDETEMSNLELLFVFDVANQDETFVVRVQDVLGREVAGFHQGEAFQSNVVVVPESGIVPFTFDVDNASDVNGGVAKMTVIVRGDGFFSNSQVFDLTQTTMSDNYWIEIVPKSEKAEEATTFVEERVELDGHVTRSSVDVATVTKDDSTDGGKILDGATAKLSIPAGTGFIGEDGQPFTPVGEVSVSMMLFSADPKGLADDENNPLYLFPGGLSPDGFDGELPSDITSPDSVTFISAGFVAIEIGDESGNKVSSFDGEGVNLEFEVPKSTVNPQTGEPLALDDGTIPIWSYTDSTGKWRYEGDAVIEQENENTFTVSKPITHLSYYNLDWYGQDRCQLDVDVVDANGDPNNQKLRLSFAKAGGGWAYKPSGWGDNPEKLNINRVPAFAGHFDLLDSQGNSLLASIEVDGEVIEVADGTEGLDLDDFCFGVSSDSTKSFKATLNIVNPPRIDIETGLSLVCPIDETKTQTVDSGYYYLYSGYSYETSGQMNGDTITFSNLVEDGLYRLYYYGGQTWAQVEFTAKADTTNISLMSLQLCDKIEQAIKTRLVCTDDDMAVTRFKAAPEAYFWMYNQDYSHYLWGRTDSDGNATQSDAVESIEYMGSAYSYFENRYYWGERTTATTSADNAITFDIQLPSSNEYCLAELPIDYLQTFVFAENTEALADGVAEIIITVQERDEFGTARESNSGTLTLTDEPSEGVVISDITSNGDGTYSAKVTSTKAQEVVISGEIDGNALGGSATVEFVAVVDFSNAVFSRDKESASADGSEQITVTVQLKDADGNDYASSGGDITFGEHTGLTLASSQDNGDGTYTAVFTSKTSQTFNITASIAGSALSNNIDIEFTPVLDTDSAVLSVDKSSASADGVEVITVTLQLKDKEGNDYTSSGGTVTFDTPTGLTQVDSQDNGDGSYTVKYKSSTSGSYTVGASLDGSKFAESISFEFTPVLDLSNTEFTRDKSSANADGSDVITVTIQLKDTEGNNYTSSGGTLELSLPAGVSIVTSQDNSDGTYTVSFSSSSSGTKSAGVSIGGTQLSSSISLSYAQVLNLSAAAFSRDKDSANADGSDQIAVTVQLKDTNGADYTSSAGEISFSVPSGVTEESKTDNGDGSYTAVFTTVNAGTYTLGVSIGGTELANDIELTFNAVIDLSQSTLQADITTIAADGSSTAQLTITLQDYAGNAFVPASNSPELTITAGSADMTDFVNTSDGVYTSNISSSVVGEVTVTATYDSGTVGTLNLTFEALPPSDSQSTITSDISTFGVGGDHSAVITVALKKADGSAYTQSYGDLVLSPEGTGLSYDTPVDNGDGTYTVSVTADTAGSYVVSATVGDLVLTNTVSLTVTQVDVALSGATPASITDSTTITVTLRDGSGNIITHGGHNISVRFASSIINQLGIATFGDAQFNSLDGTYDVSVTCNISTELDSYNVSVKVDDYSDVVATIPLRCP